MSKYKGLASLLLYNNQNLIIKCFVQNNDLQAGDKYYIYR